MTIHVKSMLLKKDNLAISYDIDLSKMVICEREYHTFFSVPQQDRIYYLLEKIDSRNGMPYFKCHTITESYSAKDAILLGATNISYGYILGPCMERSIRDLEQMGFQIRPLTIGEIRYMVNVIKGRVKYRTR